MSVLFFWEKLVEKTKDMEDFLNDHFAKVEKPDFVGPIRITDLSFGDQPPEVAIVDISDPLPNLLIAAERVHSRQAHHSKSDQGDVIQEHEAEHKATPSVQMSVHVNYTGNMHFTILTEIQLNNPTPAFMCLPIVVNLTKLEFEGTLLLVYHQNIALISCQASNPLRGPLIDVQLSTKLGDASRGKVLNNVGKLEMFIVDQLRKLVEDWLLFPNYYHIKQ
eukprot:Colp12_sorted_trinity150504_noHs@25440